MAALVCPPSLQPCGGVQKHCRKGLLRWAETKTPPDHTRIRSELTHFVDLDDTVVAWSAGGGPCDAQF